MLTLILICSTSIAPTDCTRSTAHEIIPVKRDQLLCDSASILFGQIKLHGDQDFYYKVKCEMGER